VRKRSIPSEILRKEILTLISHSPHAFLPPIHTLCSHLGAGTHTVSSILKQLHQENIIKLTPGKPTIIIGKTPSFEGDIHYQRPSEKLYASLKKSIDDLHFKEGDILPKRSHLAQMYNVSLKTVTKIMRTLANEGYVHRKGIQWHVGNGRSVKVKKFESAYVLIIQVNPHSWFYLNRDRTADFVDTIENEAQRKSVLLRGGCLVDNPNYYHTGLPDGIRNIKKYINRLDYKYRGCLIVGDCFDEKWLTQNVVSLLSVGKPVCWFNRREEQSRLPIVSPLYAEARFDERTVAQVAADHLYNLGHRWCGYTGMLFEKDWVHARNSYMSEYGKQKNPPFTIINRKQMFEYLLNADTKMLLDTLKRKIQQCHPQFGRTLDSMRKKAIELTNTHSTHSLTFWFTLFHYFHHQPYSKKSWILLPFLFHPDITCLIFPRDFAARPSIYSLGKMGFQIGKDYSLLSFDNVFDNISFPIDTINFGASHLAYSVFHFIMNDIPVQRSPDGIFFAKPFCVNSGSSFRV